MNDKKKYEMRTVNDFLKVPIDRLDDCLKEFKTALTMHKNLSELIKIAGDTLSKHNPVEETRMPSFTWIDDDKKNMKVKISIETKVFDR